MSRWPELEALDFCFLSPAEAPPGADPSAPGALALVMPRLPQLRGLNLFGADFRGDGLEHLVGLESLDLSQTEVDDTTLEKIGRLTRLESLSLDHTRITGAGLRHIASLPRLETLSLRACTLDAAGMRHLAKLPQLRSLDLEGARLDDEALAALVELKGAQVVLSRTIPGLPLPRTAQPGILVPTPGLR